MDQFCRRDLYTVDVASVPAILDPDVAAIGPAEPLERVKKRPDASLTFPIGLRVGRHQHADPSGLLRSRRERPRSGSAAEKRDEIAAPESHSITWSARVSTVGGTTRVSVPAVF